MKITDLIGIIKSNPTLTGAKILPLVNMAMVEYEKSARARLATQIVDKTTKCIYQRCQYHGIYERVQQEDGGAGHPYAKKSDSITGYNQVCKHGSALRNNQNKQYTIIMNEVAVLESSMPANPKDVMEWHAKMMDVKARATNEKNRVTPSPLKNVKVDTPTDEMIQAVVDKKTGKKAK